MSPYKVIQDSIHGSIRVEEPFLSLVATPEFERLSHIHQLGLAYLVYPGAHHTRFEHSLGTFRIAGRMAVALHLDDDEKSLVSAAALLHDIGHGPYSHTLEGPIHERTGMDHMDITKKMISEDFTYIREDYRNGQPMIYKILKKAGIDPVRVAKLVNSSPSELSHTDILSVEPGNGQAFFGEGKNYLAEIIHSPLDADQMDYLVRDAHYTGVVQGGAVDIDRILNTLTINNGELAIGGGGLSAVEGILVARALMYSSVYFHKTVRIAQQMLIKAVESLDEGVDIKSLSPMTDCELLSFLRAQGGQPADIVRRITYRDLYKVSYFMNLADMDEELKKSLASLTYKKRLELERRIAERSGVPVREVMLDIPSRVVLLSEPRYRQTEVNIMSDGRMAKLGSLSPMARALQLRPIHQWGLMVAAPREHVNKVKAVSDRILGNL